LPPATRSSRKPPGRPLADVVARGSARRPNNIGGLLGEGSTAALACRPPPIGPSETIRPSMRSKRSEVLCMTFDIGYSGPRYRYEPPTFMSGLMSATISNSSGRHIKIDKDVGGNDGS
jgi:hypothetical protein